MDFEREREIHLVVLAENGRHSSHARVTVTLQDLNDNAPVFKQSYYRTAVWEGQIPNTYVMQVCAYFLLLSDRDYENASQAHDPQIPSQEE